ncbi:MAG: CopG family transcriptional regulator [Magnetococcales bacterium]|nr:CopG family transcriptional regulator [Magnetococcales bacterium]
MLTVTMDTEIEERLQGVAEELRKPIAECLRDAVLQYVEDRRDYLTAAKALSRSEPTITLEELEKRLGMDS